MFFLVHDDAAYGDFVVLFLVTEIEASMENIPDGANRPRNYEQ